jgi:RNA polymerase sigma-70 factor, ECF subfamily
VTLEWKRAIDGLMNNSLQRSEVEMEAIVEVVGGEHRLGSSEQALLAALRAGDEDAFSVVVRLHGPRLLATARRLLRDEGSAEDAVQKTFLSAFQAIRGFSGNSRLSTWLHRIVVNHALMKLRANRSRREESIDELLPKFDDEGQRAMPLTAVVPCSESRLDERETRLAVRQAIDRLPVGYRTVILLRDIEEFDTHETADLMGTTPAAVKVRLHRARQALRTMLAPSFADDRSTTASVGAP